MNSKNIQVTSVGALLVAATFACQAFELSSNLKSGQPVPPDYYYNTFGCTGKSTSPMLQWKNPPAGTKSFAITVFDESAPTDSGFWHYVAYDIPPDTTRFEIADLTAGKLPPGAKEGNTDLGKPGYFGPCPPVGRKHTYVYTVHALKTEKLDVPSNATAAFISFNLWMNRLGKATLKVTAGPRS